MPTIKEHADMSDTPVVSMERLGSKLLGERMENGWKNVTRLTAAMRSQYGVVVSDRQWGTWERGERRIPFEVLVAFCLVVDPDGGIDFITKAIEPQYRDAWTRFLTRR